MKSLLIVLVLLLACNYAFSNCPELEGAYTCVSSKGTEVIEVMETDSNGFLAYTYSAEASTQDVELIADGKLRTINLSQIDPMLKRVRLRTNCVNDTLESVGTFGLGSPVQVTMIPTLEGMRVLLYADIFIQQIQETAECTIQ